MIHIHFIINPIAGKGIRYLSMPLLQSIFKIGVYHIVIKYTEFKKHATTLTHESKKEGAHIIVACGGDGTINEVASCLLNSDIKLGIVPLGSGNGLASNLNISKKINKALQIIQDQEISTIDVGSVNDRYFFSNTGIGFDATVIKNYESSNKRTLIGYVLACFVSLKEIKQRKHLEIKINNTVFDIDPFLVFISNSNELGYKFSLTPKALLHDGLLDVLIIKKITKLKMLWFGILVLLNKPLLLKEANYYQTNKLNVKNKKQHFFETQVDGEYIPVINQKLSIGIKPEALKVIVPIKNAS